MTEKFVIENGNSMVNLECKVELKVTNNWESYPHIIAWAIFNEIPYKIEDGMLVTRLSLRELYVLYIYMQDLTNKGVLKDTYLTM